MSSFEVLFFIWAHNYINRAKFVGLHDPDLHPLETLDSVWWPLLAVCLLRRLDARLEVSDASVNTEYITDGLQGTTLLSVTDKLASGRSAPFTSFPGKIKIYPAEEDRRELRMRVGGWGHRGWRELTGDRGRWREGLNHLPLSCPQQPASPSTGGLSG